MTRRRPLAAHLSCRRLGAACLAIALATGCAADAPDALPEPEPSRATASTQPEIDAPTESLVTTDGPLRRAAGDDASAVTEVSAAHDEASESATDPQKPAYVKVTLGWSFGCALRDDWSIECWGSDWFGSASAPSGRFRDIDAGTYHVCAVRFEGPVVCWGSDDLGRTEAPRGSFTAVSASEEHTCALDIDGEAVCWGNNESGQAEPIPGPFIAIEAGRYHTCALRQDRELACWPDSYHAHKKLPAGPFESIASGTWGACGIRVSGDLVCWSGRNIPHRDDDSYSSIAVGQRYVCAVRASGDITCWGEDRPRPSHIPAGPFVDIASLGSTCGIRPSGEIACRGWRYTGVSDAPPGEFTFITAGTAHACAMRPTGRIV